MTEMMEIYAQERVRQERNLGMVKDMEKIVDCLCASLERMRTEYCGKIEDKRRWSAAERLFDVSRQSVRCMLSASRTSVKLVRDEQVSSTPYDRIVTLMPMGAMVIGAVLTVWMMLENLNIPAALAAALTAIAWLETRVIYRRRMLVQALVDVDVNTLMRRMDRLMESMDYALEMEAQEAAFRTPLPEDAEQPTLTGDMLESVQMLMEAVQTKDGAYALKAVPRLVSALEEQDVKPVYYNKESKGYFDMYPGTEPGLTIRPALTKDGRVLARGQATEKDE